MSDFDFDDSPPPPRRVVTQAANGAAITSLVLGIVACCIGWILPIIGIVLGGLAILMAFAGWMAAADGRGGTAFAIGGFFAGAVALLVSIAVAKVWIEVVKDIEGQNVPVNSRSR